MILPELELARFLTLTLLLKKIVKDGLVLIQKMLIEAIVRVVVKDVSMGRRCLLLFFTIDVSTCRQLAKVINLP